MSIKSYTIDKITNFLLKRKAIQELQEENNQLIALKSEISNHKNIFDVDMPTVNTPFELIDFENVLEFTIIDELMITVTLPDEKLVLTIEDDYYLLEFLKRVMPLCGVCTVGRERMLLSKTTEFYLEVALDKTINLVELKEAVYNATWHIRTPEKTYDLYDKYAKDRLERRFYR